MKIKKNTMLCYKDPDSVLQLLPVAIASLVTALSVSDREVLAYMVSRSMSSPTSHSKNRPNTSPKLPHFECGCFDCYTTYWLRWDSSPNRVLIHQAIEAFEDHLDLPKRQRKRDHKIVLLKEPPFTTETALAVPEREVEEAEMEVAVQLQNLGSNHGGLARKVLPDVFGLFNSRFWSLWGPGI